MPLAICISEALRAALDSEPASVEVHRALHLAVRYFEEDEDGDPDFESVLGFEDDAEVANAVLRYVGRDELQIKLT